jgi:hypothetical protein
VDLHTAPTSIELVESKYQTALRWSTMNRQYIRSRSDLPGVEAFDEEPLEIPFVGSTKHRDAIDSALRSRSQSFSGRLQVTQAYYTVGWLYPRTIASVKVDS